MQWLKSTIQRHGCVCWLGIAGFNLSLNHWTMLFHAGYFCRYRHWSIYCRRPTRINGRKRTPDTTDICITPFQPPNRIILRFDPQHSAYFQLVKPYGIYLYIYNKNTDPFVATNFIHGHEIISRSPPPHIPHLAKLVPGRLEGLTGIWLPSHNACYFYRKLETGICAGFDCLPYCYFSFK